MKVLNWEMVEESTPGERLQPGGYVVKITNVEDVPDREYLWIVYDIAEGANAGHYSDNFGKQNEWAHRFTRSYKESAAGMFKSFLVRLEESNKGKFSVAEWQKKSDERELIGLELGIVLQKKYRTSEKTGKDQEFLEVRSVYASQDIRNGDFKIPDPIDERTSVPVATAQAPTQTYDDVPF